MSGSEQKRSLRNGTAGCCGVAPGAEGFGDSFFLAPSIRSSDRTAEAAALRQGGDAYLREIHRASQSASEGPVVYIRSRGEANLVSPRGF